MLLNQEVSPLGLKALRMTIPTGSAAFLSERERKPEIRSLMMFWI